MYTYIWTPTISRIYIYIYIYILPLSLLLYTYILPQTISELFSRLPPCKPVCICVCVCVYVYNIIILPQTTSELFSRLLPCKPVCIYIYIYIYIWYIYIYICIKKHTLVCENTCVWEMHSDTCMLIHQVFVLQHWYVRA